MDYKALGKNIRKYRRLADLTQEQLAEICECSNSHIGQIENAITKPSLEMTVRIANALHVTVDQLLVFSYNHPENILLQEIADRIAKYPSKKRFCICDFINQYIDSLDDFSLE